MTSKKTAEKEVTAKAAKKTEGRKALSIFPTNIAKLTKEECAKLSFKADGMAATIIQALEKHGMEGGDKRRQVVEQVKTNFKDASDSTIRTQVYRGIVYMRRQRNDAKD